MSNGELAFIDKLRRLATDPAARGLDDDVAVIGDDVWRQRFGGDPGVLGRELQLGGRRHAIVGVMPPGFRFPVAHSYWIPLRIAPAYEPLTGPGVLVFGRLAPGATLETARAEVAFHKGVELAEIGWFHEEVTYDDYLADFSAEFHDICDDEAFADCLAPDSYIASQGLAQQLLAAGSLGVVYPSVRKPSGTCLACFRPTLVMNVRKDATHLFRWEGRMEPVISVER